MNVEDVLQWISNKNVELFQRMQDNVTNDGVWYKARGAYDILEELRFHILHNRKDLKKGPSRGP